MKRYFLAACFCGLTACLTVAFFFQSTHNLEKTTQISSSKTDAAAKTVAENYGKLPLVFEENRGQTNEKVKFLARGAGYTLFLTESEAVLALRGGNQKDGKQAESSVEKVKKFLQSETAVLRMKIAGGSSNSKIEGLDEQSGKSNYLNGDDAQKWLVDVPNFSKVRYSQIYKGVDLIYYGNGKTLEYDFVVEPNADAKQIALEFEGAKKIELSGEGDLLLHLESGVVQQKKPFVYQNINGGRAEIAGRYVLKSETEIGFEIGEYDAAKPLVIDPVLAYGSYLGSREYEITNGIAVDAAGNAYVTGYAEPPAFPTTPGSVRPTIEDSGGDLFTFVAKFNPTGTALVYSTYLGGAGEGIAVDAAGNAYTTGYPYPNLFSTTPGALDMGRGGIGVTKLNPQGNQIIYAARFGSSGTDYAREIAIDPQGNAYVAGIAGCFTTCDFPTLNAPQPQPVSQGGGAFVAKLNAAGSALIYSTYVTGGGEEIWGIDVDPQGNAYVTGNTSSFNFPTTPGAFDRSFNCPQPPFCNPDAFITKIAPNGGSSFVYSTYLGGRGSERGWSIAVDDGGNAYATGETDGRFSGAPDEGFPTTPGAFKMFGSVDAYVTKLNQNGSALVYSTLLGGGDGSNCFTERARDIDVDRLGQAYVVGMTDCNTFPVANALQSAPTSFREEAFLTKFNQNGSALIYSTYLGGPRYDEALGVAVDASGSAYVTGETSGDFQQITPGAFDTTWNCPNGNCEHPNDIFVMKVVERLPKTLFDFDGDGKTDVSIYRPSAGEWWINRSLGGTIAYRFGASSDRIVPADFTGDGKADVAVWRGSTGEWFILRSEDASYYSFPFGANGDTPAPADYDGDGKADAAVFRPSTATWFISQSSGGTTIQQFGANGDAPVAADYDGDGKADIAIWRASAGQWWIQRSSNNSVIAFQFGNSTDKAVQGDYTGDGKADVAVWRSSTGEWFVLRSENASYYSAPFGVSTDLAAPGDYDGDGKFDFAVFRPNEARWYLLRSTSGFTAVQFGLSDDIPVPSGLVP